MWRPFPRIVRLLQAAAILSLFAAGQATAQRELDYPTPPGEEQPATVFSRLVETGNAADYPDVDHVIVLDRSVNKVIESGVTYVDHYMIYKLLTAAGCTEMSVLRWNYDPQSSHVDVVEVNIIRDGGKIPVDVAAVKDLPAPQSGIYWSDRIKTLQLPRLRIGDGIEVKTLRKGYNYALLADGPAIPGIPNSAEGDERYIPPMAGEYFDIVLLASSVPTVEKRYVLTLPKSKRLQSEVFNGPVFSRTSYTADSTIYAWWIFDAPADPHEPSCPDGSDYLPKVVISSAESWGAKSRWFFDVNRNQFEPTEAIRAKVNEILARAGLKRASEEKQAEALVHWVAQNIRYSGQTMGEGEGFTLHPGAMIFQQRSGVCKDIAGMLITMMRAADMDSYAAMTMAGSRIEDLPADQFNHCICALRKDDGRYVMYDPTWVPFNNDIWSKLETEQHYVIGSPEGEKLMQIRYSPPEESPLKIVHRAKLLVDGTLEGTMELYGSGALDSRLRRLCYQRRIRDLEDYFGELLGAQREGVENVTVRHREVDDFSGDMWYKISYRIRNFALVTDGACEFTSPALNMVLGHIYLFRGSSVDWPEDRKSDVFLYYTQLLDISESISLPKGYRLNGKLSSEVVDETYGYFRGTAGMAGKSLVLNHRIEVRRRQIPPGGELYHGFRRAMEEAHAWGERVIRVEKGGAR